MKRVLKNFIYSTRQFSEQISVIKEKFSAAVRNSSPDFMHKILYNNIEALICL